MPTLKIYQLANITFSGVFFHSCCYMLLCVRKTDEQLVQPLYHISQRDKCLQDSKSSLNEVTAKRNA